MSKRGQDPKKAKVSATQRKPDQPPDPSIDEKADWIGQQLRQVYDETVNEPIPDRLQALLRQLKDDEGEGQST